MPRGFLFAYLTSIALGLKKEAINLKASKVFSSSTSDSAKAYVREMEVAPAILSSAIESSKWDDCYPHSGDVLKRTIACLTIERGWETNKNRYSSPTHHLY